MVTHEQIAERLGRFEAIAGLEYNFISIDIWYEKFKSWDADRFNCHCGQVENKIKWHILPTLNDFYKESEPKWKQP